MHTNGVAETIRRLVGSFPKEERSGKTIDIIETARLIIWQKLIKTVDNKRVALREFLCFDEKVRDKLLEADPTKVTEAARRLLHEYGQPMVADAEKKFKDGIISEREFRIIESGNDDI